MPRNRADSDILWLPGFETGGGLAVLAEPDDLAARERALDAAGSFIVQAPAGSGKTELLIQRYLALLARVDLPESIVAITFTIKAAGEMRSRVLDALRLARGPQPAAPHERRTWQIAREALRRDEELAWDLLGNPGRMRIQTIDALSMAITARMPWLARFGAMPQVTEKPQEMYARAASETLKLLSGRDSAAAAVAVVLEHLDNHAAYARDLLARMLETRDHWLRVIGASGDAAFARAALESTLQEIVSSHLAALRAAAPSDLHTEIVQLARYAAANVEADHALAACCGLDALPGDAPGEIGKWSGIRALLLTEKGGLRKKVDVNCGFPPGNRSVKRRWDSLAARLDPCFLDLLRDVAGLPPTTYAASQWRVLEALFTLLPLAVAQLRLVFAEAGVVDFPEIAQAALRALRTGAGPTDLALTMGARIQHLLVDEFQDTSVAQYELLKALTAAWEPGDGATLFLVGDPMQSIYRFRQAEVGLFLKIRESGLGAVQPESLNLTTNFRSLQHVVEWINDAFAPAFPDSEDPYTGAVSYAPSTPWNRSGDGSVEMHPMFGRDDRAEAALVLRIVERIHREDPKAKVAILVRARTHLPAIAEALRSRPVPFRAIEIDALGERPVVHDLLSLTRALLHLADRTAWLAILRAPWCGLTLSDLHAIAGPRHDVTVWDALNRSDLELSADGAARIARAKPVLGRALAARGRIGVRSLVERAWIALGGPACLRTDAELDDARACFDLLEGLGSAGDIADFDCLAQRASELFANPDPSADGSLELMTIHKAKGLEFDAVIIPGLSRRPKIDDPALLVWTERPSVAGAELLLAPISPRRGETDRLASYITHLERTECEHEAIRLLYVAATRARRELHLIGHVEMKEEDGVRSFREPPTETLLHRLWPAVSKTFEAAFAADPTDLPKADMSKLDMSLRRIPAQWRPAPPPQPVRLSRPAAPRPTAADDMSSDDVSRAAGTLVHSFLERIARDGLENWPESRLGALGPAIRAALLNMGTPSPELEAAAATVQTALANTLRDPRGRWILDNHEDAHSEFQLTGALNGAPAHFAIDRTFVDAGVRWIVDFKTSPVLPEAGLDAYREQLTGYARLMAEIDPRPIRVGLYFPLLQHWIEWSPTDQN